MQMQFFVDGVPMKSYFLRLSMFVLLGALLLLTFGLPVLAKKPYPSLVASVNPDLQKGLESCLLSLNLKQAVKDKSLCVTLVDITDPDDPRLAAVNGDEMLYAASLPKIAILFGAFERIERGELSLTHELREKLTRMIRNSSNQAATEMLNLVGKDYLARLLESPRYRLYDPDMNGGLWVGKDYGKAGAWKRDPLHNLSHGATANQVARFYYLLETGRLVSPEMSQEMKDILADPAIHHKFVKGLEQARPGAKIYRKSGTWRDYHADSGIIEHDGHRYIAVALAHDPAGGKWLSKIIVSLDDLICRSGS
jgi:beta-lactamase class A